MPSKRSDLQALRGLLVELERVLRLGPQPKGIAARSEELMQSIMALTDDLIERTPAAVLGALGGQKTAERGSEYYRELAAKRKTKAGGRPKKETA